MVFVVKYRKFVSCANTGLYTATVRATRIDGSRETVFKSNNHHSRETANAVADAWINTKESER